MLHGLIYYFRVKDNDELRTYVLDLINQFFYYTDAALLRVLIINNAGKK